VAHAEARRGGESEFDAVAWCACVRASQAQRGARRRARNTHMRHTRDTHTHLLRRSERAVDLVADSHAPDGVRDVVQAQARHRARAREVRHLAAQVLQAVHIVFDRMGCGTHSVRVAIRCV
jgi:hypothetical protein